MDLMLSLVIIASGAYMIIRPSSFSNLIKSLYSKYPIIRYAGEKQLSARSGLIRFAGLVIILVGFFVLNYA